MGSSAGTSLVVDGDTFMYFATRALHGMRNVVVELGDPAACQRPSVPGANTAYGLLSHCLGVTAYWAGHVVAGREVVRDRQAEFAATGPVAELAARVDAAVEQLGRDVATVEPGRPVRNPPARWALGPDRLLDQSGALLHLYEELAQHHGQMEILRDAARSPDTAASPVNPSLEWLRAKHGVKWHRPGRTLLPAWVADMDYPVAPVIRRSLLEVLNRGDLGYPDWPANPLANVFSSRMQARFGWSPDPGHVRGVTDLIQALQIILQLATEPGDRVIAHTPNYPPFLATIANMRRVLVAAPLLPDGPDSWTWDHDQLRRAARASNAKILLLVNPHNPTGRVFTRNELMRLAELADELDLLVIGDEIHADLVYHPHVHTPFASLDPHTAARTVTITSATKAFNIAGLRTAVAHIAPAAIRAAWDSQPPDLFGALNVLGVEATRAAWTHGDDWLTTVRDHLKTQRDDLLDRLTDTPLVMRPPQATYLAWIDTNKAHLPGDPATWFRNHARLELSRGADFGPGNERFVRLNFATSRDLLHAMIDAALDAGH